MVISVEIAAASERRLAELAERQGKSIEEYASEILQKALEGSKSFSEILEPFRREVAESGMDEAALDSLFESTRNAVASKTP